MNDELRIMNGDWVECTLGEVFFTTSGGTPSRRNKGFYDGKIPWVKSGELDKGVINKTEENISEDAVKKSSAKIFPKGTLLIALYGATIGKLAFLGVDATTNQAICGIYKNDNISHDFLFYYLFFRKPKLISKGSGGAQPNISQTILKKLLFPIAPLPIQRAIVAKIEALFSDLDNGIANLKKAQEQLKIYRQAVLKKAFEGELTKEWREDIVKTDVVETHGRASQPKKPTKPKKLKELPPLTDDELKELPKLPNGWVWCKTGSLCQKIQIGPFGTQLHKHDYKDEGIPIINPKHIKNQKINPQIFISKSKAVSLPQYILKTNDIILGRRGEMGRTAFITERYNDWFCVTGSLYIRLGDKFNGKLYSLIISERRVVNYLNKKGSGTTMTNLNASIINELPIQLISLSEQNQIVQEIETRLSVCDKVEQSITESLEKAKALRQSILKKAFEGRLLSEAEVKACKQEPDYEHASVLLARIERSRNEKIKAEKVKTHGRASQRTSKKSRKNGKLKR